MKRRHVILGCACWLAVGIGGFALLNNELRRQSGSLSALASDIGQWVTGQQQTHRATAFGRIAVAREDPIFIETADGDFRQIGHVLDVDDSPVTGIQYAVDIRVQLSDEALEHFPDGYYLDYYTTPMALEWVGKMLIPPERQQEIADLIRSDWELHGEVVMTELRPVMQEGLRQAIAAVESELPGIIRQHRDEFRSLGDRFETDILQEDLIPLIREEIIPVIRVEAQPLAMDIGKSLWKRVSLWSFTWRYLYDSTRLSDGDALQQEFQRFINREAIPELESRTEEFIQVTRSIIRRVMANPLVKDTVRSTLQRVAEDPQLQRIVWQIVRSATIDNDALRRELDELARSPETRAALRFTSDRLEPTVRSIGDLIFGTRTTGITPEFSRILRSQILEKDRRWFVMRALPPGVEAPDERASAVAIHVAPTPMLFPLKFAGTQQSPLTPVPFPDEDDVSLPMQKSKTRNDAPTGEDDLSADPPANEAPNE